jgi:hypothetical protein
MAINLLHYSTGSDDPAWGVVRGNTVLRLPGEYHAFHATGPVARPRRRVVRTVVRRHLRRQTHSDNERGRRECNCPSTCLRMQRNYKFETFVALRLWRPVGAQCRRRSKST